MKCLTMYLVSIFFIMTAFADSDPLIPGKVAGRVQLGTTREAVYTMLGVPQSDRTASEGQGVPREVWESQDGSSLFVYYRDGNVVQVKITSSALKTPEGFTIGKSLAEAKRRYGKLKKFTLTSDEGGQPYYWDDAGDKGIAFCVTPVEGHSEHEITAIAIHPSR